MPKVTKVYYGFVIPKNKCVKKRGLYKTSQASVNSEKISLLWATFKTERNFVSKPKADNFHICSDCAIFCFGHLQRDRFTGVISIRFKK
jgi:hypothetical protein